MSNIYIGPRQQVMSDISDMCVVRDLTNMYQIWHTPVVPPKHIVFIVDKDTSLTDYKPRPDRHIALLDQDKVPSKIQTWVIKHKIPVKVALNPTRDQLYTALVSGKIGVQLTPEAAELLLTLRPRGLQSLYWPIEQLKDLDLPQPISSEAMMGQWPISHEVDVYNLFRVLGKLSAIKLADQVSDDKAWGGMYMLTKLCSSRPFFLEYLEILKDRIHSSEIRPEIAIKLFARACYLHAQGLDAADMFHD